MITRRRFQQFLGAGSIALATGSLVRYSHASSIEWTDADARTSRLHSFRDGLMRVPVSLLYHDPNDPALKELIDTATETEDRPVNVTLLEEGTRKILFDVGSGTGFLPGLGALPEQLDLVGITPDQITDVVFTHAHPDHLWGLLDDFDDLMYPEANYHFPAQEFDYWMSDQAMIDMPEERKVFAVGARSRLEVLADQVNPFHFGERILDDIEAVDSRGHTPGHAALVLHRGGDSTMILGDALTHPQVSFARPDILMTLDQDAAQAAQTRKRLLDRLAHEKMRLLGYHLPDDGIGYVESMATGYRLVR